MLFIKKFKENLKKPRKSIRATTKYYTKKKKNTNQF